jgi:hypothetical protein
MSDLNTLISNRAELLAQVALTRSPAVDVLRLDVGGEMGIDFLCSIGAKKAPTFRAFGVLVWGTSEQLDTPEDLARHVRGRKGKLKKRAQYFFPVIILLATMHNDQVFYSWLVEPTKDTVQLMNVDDLNFQSFNSVHYERVIKRIINWYARLAETVFPGTEVTDLSRGFDDEW